MELISHVIIISFIFEKAMIPFSTVAEPFIFPPTMHKDFILWPTLIAFSLYVRQTPDRLELPLCSFSSREDGLKLGQPPIKMVQYQARSGEW